MFKLRNKILQLPQIGWFLLRLTVGPKWDRLLSRPSREKAALDHVRQHAPAGDPQAVLRCMDEFATTRGFLMNVGPRKGEVLMRALEASQAQRMLEIGAYCGYSAVLAGELLQQRGGQLISVEKSRRCAAIARQVVEHAGLEGAVSVLAGVLADHIDDFDRPFDAVFLDHWKEEYLPDLKRLEAAGLLRDGSVIVADNIEFFDVPQYLEYVRDGGHYDSTFHKASVEYNEGIDDGVEVSIFRCR